MTREAAREPGPSGAPGDDARSVREFVRACHAVARDIAERSGRPAYSPTQQRVLLEVGARPGIAVVELRAALGIDAGQLSRALRRLRTGGAVRLRPCPVDRRRRTVELTDAGRRGYEQVAAAHRRAADELLRRLPAAERAGLVTAMDTVHRHLTAALRHTPPGQPAAGSMLR